LLPKQVHSSDLTYLIFITLLGLFLIVLLAFFPPTTTENIPWRKTLIGSIFSTICFLGCLAVFSPTFCTKNFKPKKKTIGSRRDQFYSHKKSSSVQGHHSSCGKFTAHTFQIQGMIFCTACAGLLVGGLLTLPGSLLYFFFGWNITDNSFILLFMGVLGVGFGLLQQKFRSFIRLSLNTVFVLGTFFILIGIDEIIHSLFIDLFVASMILFWLFTRISLSQQDHERICLNCGIVDCTLVS